MSFFVSCVWLDLNHSLLRSPKATEGVGEQVKTIEYRFYEAINENKERDEPSVSEASRRSQATISNVGPVKSHKSENLEPKVVLMFFRVFRQFYLYLFRPV